MDKKHIIYLADQYEQKSFIADDPIRFVVRYNTTYSDVRNIEIAAVFAQWLSYGSRFVFLERLEMLFDVIGSNPIEYIKGHSWCKYEGDYRTIYRFNTWHNFYNLCDKLHKVYMSNETLEDAVVRVLRSNKISQLGFNGSPVKYYHSALGYWLSGDTLIPLSDSPSVCKKLNMMLRWMVRRDSKVDIGIWKQLSPTNLLVPIDTHVLQSATKLNIIESERETMGNCLKITNYGKLIFPHDPARLDFALYGMSIYEEEADNLV